MQTALALKSVGTDTPVYTVRKLTEICQTLEEAHVSAHNYVPPPPNSKNTIEPGLAYRRQNQIQSRVAEISGNQNNLVNQDSNIDIARSYSPNISNLEPQVLLNPTCSNVTEHNVNLSSESLSPFNQLNSISYNRGVKCWNCGQEGHQQNSCREPLKLHCFRCGKADVTIRPNCSGKSSPSQ